MNKCLVFLTAVLLAGLPSLSAKAEPIPTPGIGMNITQNMSGDLLKLEVRIVAPTAFLFGFDIKFNPNDYELVDELTGTVLKNSNGEVVIGSMFTEDSPPLSTIITLKKKGNSWGEIAPGELQVFTVDKKILSFEPLHSFTPKQIVVSLDNYPNPFNPETEIRYSLPADGVVKLTVYNMVGQVVRTLVDERVVAGNHVVKWDAIDDNGQRVAAGIYFYRLASPSGKILKKMLLLK